MVEGGSPWHWKFSEIFKHLSFLAGDIVGTGATQISLHVCQAAWLPDLSKHHTSSFCKRPSCWVSNQVIMTVHWQLYLYFGVPRMLRSVSVISLLRQSSHSWIVRSLESYAGMTLHLNTGTSVYLDPGDLTILQLYWFSSWVKLVHAGGGREVSDGATVTGQRSEKTLDFECQCSASARRSKLYLSRLLATNKMLLCLPKVESLSSQIKRSNLRIRMYNTFSWALFFLLLCEK